MSEEDKRTEHMKSTTCIQCDEDIFNLDGTTVAGNWGCVCCGRTVHVRDGCGQNNQYGEVACEFCIQEGHYVQEHISEYEIIIRSTCQGWAEVPEGYEARQHHQVGGPFYDENGVEAPYENS
jgi:hypothetical protein